MRRTSLTPIQARQLGRLLRQHREQRGLGIRGLEAASGVNGSSIVSLERGDILAPQPDTLKSLAAALAVPVSDLFTVAGWLPVAELPTIRPYLRAKYRQLDEGAIADLENYAEELTRRHGGNGPIGREDEHPQYQAPMKGGRHAHHQRHRKSQGRPKRAGDPPAVPPQPEGGAT